MTISEAAENLGVSTRTVRRYIKAGKIEARLVAGPFGEEYRIDSLPKSFTSARKEEAASGEISIQGLEDTPVRAMDIIKDLQETNLALAAQLGATTERVRTLENQLKLLTGLKRKPWWRRIFSR